MAHAEQRFWLESIKTERPDLFSGVSVIEIGSLNINGTVRDLFNASRYVGVDVAEGAGVDRVCLGQEVDDPADSFDVAISAECFEHNPAWLATFRNMHRLAARAVLFTCATEGRPEHGTVRTTPQNSPLTVGLGWNYYQNLTAADFTGALDLDDMFAAWRFEHNDRSKDLYFFGEKG